MMYIATAAKEALRPYSGQSIEIDAQEVFQPVNPGDGTIRKFAVLGPSVHLGGGRAEDLPIIQGLTLKAGLIAGRKIPNLTMEIRNAGNASITVNAGALGYAVFGKKMPTTADYWVYPSDGSSTAYITRVSVCK